MSATPAQPVRPQRSPSVTQAIPAPRRGSSEYTTAQSLASTSRRADISRYRVKAVVPRPTNSTLKYQKNRAEKCVSTHILRGVKKGERRSSRQDNGKEFIETDFQRFGVGHTDSFDSRVYCLILSTKLARSYFGIHRPKV